MLIHPSPRTHSILPASPVDAPSAPGKDGSQPGHAHQRRAQSCSHAWCVASMICRCAVPPRSGIADYLLSFTRCLTVPSFSDGRLKNATHTGSLAHHAEVRLRDRGWGQVQEDKAGGYHKGRLLRCDPSLTPLLSLEPPRIPCSPACSPSVAAAHEHRNHRCVCSLLITSNSALSFLSRH